MEPHLPRICTPIVPDRANLGPNRHFCRACRRDRDGAAAGGMGETLTGVRDPVDHSVGSRSERTLDVTGGEGLVDRRDLIGLVPWRRRSAGGVQAIADLAGQLHRLGPPIAPILSRRCFCAGRPW